MNCQKNIQITEEILRLWATGSSYIFIKKEICHYIIMFIFIKQLWWSSFFKLSNVKLLKANKKDAIKTYFSDVTVEKYRNKSKKSTTKVDLYLLQLTSNALPSYSTNIYLIKVNIETLEKGWKFAQS